MERLRPRKVPKKVQDDEDCQTVFSASEDEDATEVEKEEEEDSEGGYEEEDPGPTGRSRKR